MYVNLKECEAAGVDPAEVAKLARRLEKCAKDASALGLQIFGSGVGDLRQAGDEHPLVLASLGVGFDGGAGDVHIDEDGLQRGE